MLLHDPPKKFILGLQHTERWIPASNDEDFGVPVEMGLNQRQAFPGVEVPVVGGFVLPIPLVPVELGLIHQTMTMALQEKKIAP